MRDGDTEFRRETHISTKRPGAQETAWIPGAQSHQGRDENPLAPPGQGPQAPLGLKRVCASDPVQDGKHPILPHRPVSLGRLKKRAGFLRLRKGRSWRTGALVLQARRNAGEPGARENSARFGFTVTKRLGTAVTRNRARRRLKETVRLMADAHARPGYDYVVIARHGALTRSFAQLQKDLCIALEGVHKEPSARA